VAVGRRSLGVLLGGDVSEIAGQVAGHATLGRSDAEQ
jgi:hypothetical protein